MNSRTPTSRTRHHGAFTLLELLLAASVTALIAAAGATVISGVSNAAVQTRDIRVTQTAGHYTTSRFARLVREARVIGQVTANSVTLWLEDTNKDDKVNLYELGLIRYDSVNKQVVFDYLQAAGATPTTVVSKANLTSSGAVTSILTSGDHKTAVWADGVENFSFKGYPTLTETRIVQVAFDIGTGDEAMRFQSSASPRAPADYLLESTTNLPSLPGSTRSRRKVISIWDGIKAVQLGT